MMNNMKTMIKKLAMMKINIMRSQMMIRMDLGTRTRLWFVLHHRARAPEPHRPFSL